DFHVTGVQTCALPILSRLKNQNQNPGAGVRADEGPPMTTEFTNHTATPMGLWDTDNVYHVVAPYGGAVALEPSESAQETIDILEIGRASCRKAGETRG